MSIWKAALLGATIPLALVLPALAQPPGDGARMIFEALDLDGDGAVTQEELAEARGARFAEADANDDGALDREELLAMGRERMERGVDRMLARADTDGDGALTETELAALREERGREGGIARMFDRVDADGDGSLSEAEIEAAADAFRARRGGHGHGRVFDGDRG
jgi:Ca2+-binding EF-hand superfamily protein